VTKHFFQNPFFYITDPGRWSLRM